MSTISSVLKVSPSLYDIIRLPKGQLALYLTGTTTVGFLFHMGVVRSLRWARLRTGCSSKLELTDDTTPRLLLSSLLQFGLVYAGGFLFEALYANVPIVPKAVEGAAWCLRRLVGLSGTAPYQELSGGGLVASVLVPMLEIERVLTCFLPRTFGTCGFNVVPLTAEQISDVFAPSGGSELPGRFLTPSRLIRIALQMGCGAGLVGLIRTFVIPRVLGVKGRLRQRFNPSPYCAVVTSILWATAVVRDAETIGTRFQINLLGITILGLLPNCLVFEYLFGVFFNPAPQHDHYPTDANMDGIAEKFGNVILRGIPLKYMSREERSIIERVLLGTSTSAMCLGDTQAFAGCLAALTAFIVVQSTIRGNPLSVYERSLERINAELGDEVFERQASVESVANDTSETCTICLRAERPESQDMLRIKACRHEFHTECLAQWMQQSTMCPLCRSPLKGDISEQDRRSLDEWRAMSLAQREAAVWRRCVWSSSIVLDALTVDPIDETYSSAFLNMVTVSELVAIMEGCEPIDLGHLYTPLIVSMGEVFRQIQEKDAFPFMSMVEDVLSVMIAPVVPEPLFSGAFKRRKNLMALASSSEPSIVFKLMFWLHFHF